MGNVKVTQVVNIRSGGSSGSSTPVLVIGGLLLLAAMGGGGLTVATGMLLELLWWIFGTVMAVIVLIIVLAIVFRRHIGPPRVIYRGEASLSRDPDRDMPKVKAPDPPREIIHTHRHYVIGPTGLYSEMPGWDRLVDAEIVEAEILP